jgi:hypothetical protein
MHIHAFSVIVINKHMAIHLNWLNKLWVEIIWLAGIRDFTAQQSQCRTFNWISDITMYSNNRTEEDWMKPYVLVIQERSTQYIYFSHFIPLENIECTSLFLFHPFTQNSIFLYLLVEIKLTIASTAAIHIVLFSAK